MLRNFTNEHFERFLKENVEQLKLYPSANVWKNISRELDKRRRWYIFGMSVFLLSASLLGYLLIENNAPLSPKRIATAEVEKPISATHQNLGIQRNSRVQNSTVETQPGIIPHSEFQTVPNTTGVQNIIDENQPEYISELISGIVEHYIGEHKQTPFSDIVANNFFKENTTGTNKTVTNLFRKKNKIGLQFYFTPTISYRKLGENKSYTRTAQPGGYFTYSQFRDVNNAVTHKPDMGAELGLTAKYPVSQNLKLRAGVQFNVNRYDIRAFNYPLEIATIALTTGNRVDSVATISDHRNYNGTREDWLQNLYFQVSAPVGVEVKLHGDDRMQFGVASTIQPTYILGDQAYLLSSDYKNYAEVPWLIRKWNVNTNIETFVNYSTGHLKWQVGPQVRYQLLSSFVKKYPVKENLFDFGLKVGISLNNQ
ncbi:MAG: hypothetical protein ICV66_01715 [Chitinophagaceae bacterium]|nr:hypothetical protein [Chitinophagaceae bacterium]